MKVGIKYSNIFERCRNLSEYEAEQTESGMFAQIVLTDAEDVLLKPYAQAAFRYLESIMPGAVNIEDGDVDSDISIVLSDGLYVSSSQKACVKFVKNIEEATSAYCVYMWLLNKLPERSKAYQNIFTDMADVCRKLAYTLGTPHKVKRNQILPTQNIEVSYE